MVKYIGVVLALAALGLWSVGSLASKDGGQDVELRHALERAPRVETQLITAVIEAKRVYSVGQNDMAKGDARTQRAKLICDNFKTTNTTDWVGAIERVSTSKNGKGALALKIGDNLFLGTWNNRASDISDQTLIDPASKILKVASSLKVGQLVRFSGSFVGSERDCFKESSVTLEASINQPQFIFRFSDLQPL